MAVNLFTFVDLYTRLLVTADHLLTKGAEHAAATGISEAEMLDWRLVGDMQPLSFQLMVVCNFSTQWPARVLDLPLPESIGTDLDVAGYHAAIASSLAWLAALTPARFEGRDETPLSIPIGDGSIKPTLPAGQWLSVFSTTNLYFHLSTVYGILRAHGVPIGKLDLFASGF
jgi:hypothetical protein